MRCISQIARRYLDAADQLQPRRLRKRNSRIKARERIVIGNGQRTEPHAHSFSNQFLWREGSIRTIRVAVKIYHGSPINRLRPNSLQIFSTLSSIDSLSEWTTTSGWSGAS